MGCQDEDLLWPGECHVMEAHTVELSDSGGGFEERPLVQGPQVPINLLRTRELGRKRPYYHNRKFEALCLVDGHHLHVALGQRLVRVFVLVDAPIIKQAEEAIEQVEAED